jgi:thiol-disulfide isomerase/thioredoxin
MSMLMWNLPESILHLFLSTMRTRVHLTRVPMRDSMFDASISCKSILGMVIIGCTLALLASTSNAGNIVIDNNTDQGSFGFFYWDSFNDSKNSLMIEPVTADSNRYVIASDVPLIVVLLFNGVDGHPVLLKPGDTLRVNVEGDHFVFKGNRPNDDFVILDRIEQQIGFVFPDNMGLMLSNRLDIPARVDKLYRKHKAREALVERYKAQNPESGDRAAIIEAVVYQKFLIEILFPFYTRHEPAGFDFKKIPASYYADLEAHIKGYANDSLIYLQNYQLYLYNYCRYLSRNSLNTSEEFMSMFSNAAKQFSGRSREFCLFLILKKYTGLGLKEYDSCVEKFLQDYPRSDFGQYVVSLTSSEQTSAMNSASDEILKTSGNETVSWKEILQQTGGKVLYIDFWASWCGPCLQEMPASNELRENFKNDPVVFLYVSTDKNENAWRKALEKLHQPANSHLMLQGDSKLFKVFGLKSIPHYVIVDKAGRVFAFNAQRPSDRALVETLRSVLKN